MKRSLCEKNLYSFKNWKFSFLNETEVNGLFQAETIKGSNLTAQLCLVASDWTLHRKWNSPGASLKGKPCNLLTLVEYYDILWHSRTFLKHSFCNLKEWSPGKIIIIPSVKLKVCVTRLVQSHLKLVELHRLELNLQQTLSWSMSTVCLA